MPDFRGFDPQGRLVVLYEGTFNHIVEGHRELAPHRRDIEATLVSPDFILSNAATFGRSSFQKERTADVRYIRFSEKLGLHIVVPAETVQVRLQVGADDPISHEGRVARTAYPTAQVPSNTKRLYWRST